MMTKSLYHMAWLALSAAGIVACSGRASSPSAPAGGAPSPGASISGAPGAAAPAVASPRELLSRVVERYWEENAAAGPWNSWGGAEMRYGEAPADTLAPQALADSLAREHRYLDELSGMARAPLDANGRLTYDIFRRERELTIESFTFPSELLPVNAYDSVPLRFASMAAAAERQALMSQRDFEVWRSRALAYQRWTDQAIDNLREGARRGYTLPLAVVSRTLPLLAALAADTPDGVFRQALRAAPGTSDDAERVRLGGAIVDVVREKILPCYGRLHDFMQREYLPRARTSVGLSALPLGPAWYGYLAKRATDGVQTPAELHAQGVAEVERLRARLQSALAEAGFAGNAQGFLDGLRNDPHASYRTADELLNAYQDLKTQVAGAAPTLFSVAPHADFEIRSVENFRAATAPALSYRPSLASGRNPAVLYVDTADLEARPAILLSSRYLREAVPGHHYQLALQQERADLPRFRRFGGAPAFIAGWGLYAATLGEELGVYRQPEGKFGALLQQLECAAGVVIDTGIHAQNWSRAQALDYLHAQLPLDEPAAANRVDRVLALPGEALSCMAGLAKLQGLRARVQQTLGARFDVQAFHAELLRNGAVPLDLLDGDMKHWAEVSAKVEPVPAPVEANPKLE
jgi:uncharacterized protein (DUF885 family)